jgi:hypothetical protein
VRACREPWLAIGSAGHDHEHALVNNAICGPVNQLERGGIDPVGVLEHRHDRLPSCEPAKLRDHSLESAGTPRPRGEVDVGRACSRLKAHQASNQGQGLANVLGRHAEQRFQLAELRLVRVAVREAGGPLELAHHRPERGAGVVRRALVTDHEARPGGDRVDQRARDPRLADPGLAEEQHDLPLAGFGSLPALQEQGELPRAADQRHNRGAVQRVEPALRPALAPHR